MSGCTIFALTEYINCEIRVGQYLHQKIRKICKIKIVPNRYKHKPLPVIDNNNITILWDFPVQTDRTIQANRPDIIIKDETEKPEN